MARVEKEGGGPFTIHHSLFTTDLSPVSLLSLSSLSTYLFPSLSSLYLSLSRLSSRLSLLSLNAPGDEAEDLGALLPRETLGELQEGIQRIRLRHRRGAV